MMDHDRPKPWVAEVTDGRDHAERQEEDDIEEELGYISPLDNVDPYITFKQALTSTYSPSNVSAGLVG